MNGSVNIWIYEKQMFLMTFYSIKKAWLLFKNIF